MVTADTTRRTLMLATAAAPLALASDFDERLEWSLLSDLIALQEPA